MRLRQAKKIMEWCKGNGDYYTINRSKDHRKSFWRKCQHIRHPYYDEERGVSVHTSCHDIDIIRRAHTRLFRWIRKGKKKTKISQGINNKTTAALYSWRYDDNEVDKICTQL